MENLGINITFSFEGGLQCEEGCLISSLISELILELPIRTLRSAIQMESCIN